MVLVTLTGFQGYFYGSTDRLTGFQVFYGFNDRITDFQGCFYNYNDRLICFQGFLRF